jgi:predicted RNase H-like HicB family nuclease
MSEYIALIHKEPGSDYGVSFPDFPGCISAGKTLDEARAAAVEALALHIEGMIEDGETIPAASTLETGQCAGGRNAWRVPQWAAPRAPVPGRDAGYSRANCCLPRYYASGPSPCRRGKDGSANQPRCIARVRYRWAQY